MGRRPIACSRRREAQTRRQQSRRQIAHERAPHPAACKRVRFHPVEIVAEAADELIERQRREPEPPPEHVPLVTPAHLQGWVSVQLGDSEP